MVKDRGRIGRMIIEKVWVEDRVPGDHTEGNRFVVMVEDRVPGDHTEGNRFVVMRPTIEDSNI